MRLHSVHICFENLSPYIYIHNIIIQRFSSFRLLSHACVETLSNTENTDILIVQIKHYTLGNSTLFSLSNPADTASMGADQARHTVTWAK